jgi:hypothetical protein
MAFSNQDNSATISTTEWFLYSNSGTATYQTTDCVMQAVIDLGNLVAGDSFRVRVYEKVNAGSAKTVYDATFSGVQATPLLALPRITVCNGWEVSIIKTAGTDRAIPWSIRLQTADTTDISSLTTAVSDIQSRLPAALVSGRMDSSVGAMATGVVTASAIAANAITAAKVATDAIGAAQLAADAVTEIQSGLATSSALSTVAGYVDTEVAAIKAKTDNLPSDPADASDIAAATSSISAAIAALPSAATIATAVWAVTIETGFSALQSFRGLLSLVGKHTDSSLEDGSGVFYAPDGVTARITYVIVSGIKTITRNW